MWYPYRHPFSCKEHLKIDLHTGSRPKRKKKLECLLKAGESDKLAQVFLKGKGSHWVLEWSNWIFLAHRDILKPGQHLEALRLCSNIIIVLWDVCEKITISCTIKAYISLIFTVHTHFTNVIMCWRSMFNSKQEYVPTIIRVALQIYISADTALIFLKLRGMGLGYVPTYRMPIYQETQHTGWDGQG